MSEYLAPGVFVEEARHGRGPIAAVDTSTTAFVGPTQKGPRQTPTAIASFAEFQETFGPASHDSLLSMAALLYFSNGGRSAVVVSTSRARERGGRRLVGGDLVGHEKDETGIHALAKSATRTRGPAARLLVMPDTAMLAPREHATMLETILPYCTRHRLFYLVDPPAPPKTLGRPDKAVDWAKRNDATRHPNAAVYFPRVEMTNPSRRSESMLVPASGAIAGIYARIDRRRGVWKAPAGTEARLLGIKGVEIALTDSQMRALRRVDINPIRPLSDRCVLVWGARTFAPHSKDSGLHDVNVRRLLLFIEESLHEGLSWVVFEPNGESLWAQIRLSMSSFMNHLWCAGALNGRSAREAYFVKCGRDTMSERDLDDGRLVALVGFAPLKPAEFVVLRICLSTADTK